MRLLRFYVPDIELDHYMVIRDADLLKRWSQAGYQKGQEIVLFDGLTSDRLYVINELYPKAAKLELVTELARKLPKREVYLFWALLKKDLNDLVLQKCTELGVSHFVPILTERSVRSGFGVDEAKKIVIDRAEQSERSDIPNIREPLLLQTAVQEFSSKLPLYVCDGQVAGKQKLPTYDSVGVFIGPPEDWSDSERKLFSLQEIPALHLGDLSLSAETAAVVAATKLLQ